MAPKISAATSVRGVVAYQDDQNSNVFHYYPQIAETILNETLLEFRVKYWGIGDKYIIQDGSHVFDGVGATLAGKAKIGITPAQNKAITEQIKSVFNIESPSLVPLGLDNVVVTPYFAENALYMKDQPQDFPKNIQFDTAFNYVIESPQNSQLAFYVGSSSKSKLTADPSFAVGIEGEAEFVGDPWTVVVRAELKKVWKYVKEKFSGRGHVGWFKVKGVEFQQTMVDIISSKVIDTEFVEGTLATEQYGRQILEMGKDILKGLDTSGDFFKFEPTPKVEDMNFMGILDGWGWSVSINASYMSMEIDQQITYEQKISYTGRFTRKLPASMSLSIDCNADTKQYFVDIGNTAETCITQEKIDKFNKRLEEEFNRQKDWKNKVMDAYIDGRITYDQFLERNRVIEGKIPGSAFKFDEQGELIRINPLDFMER